MKQQHKIHNKPMNPNYVIEIKKNPDNLLTNKHFNPSPNFPVPNPYTTNRSLGITIHYPLYQNAPQKPIPNSIQQEQQIQYKPIYPN